MSQYQYGTLFEELGILGMGRQGAGWCGLDPNGVMALMAHQVFFHARNGKWYYESPGDARLPTIAASASRSIRMLSEYFQSSHELLLPVGVFSFDGGFDENGKHLPSSFKYATGEVYRARMLEFDANTGYIRCEVLEKFSV